VSQRDGGIMTIVFRKKSIGLSSDNYSGVEIYIFNSGEHTK